MAWGQSWLREDHHQDKKRFSSPKAPFCSASGAQIARPHGRELSVAVETFFFNNCVLYGRDEPKFKKKTEALR